MGFSISGCNVTDTDAYRRCGSKWKVCSHNLQRKTSPWQAPVSWYMFFFTKANKFERPLAGSYRPGEGAFSVFRRFRVYGGAGVFFAFGWASTLPRRKGGVATRLRRRERGFSSGTVIPCPFLLRSRDNNSTDCRTASSHTYPSYRRVRRTRNIQTTQPIFLSAILSFEPIARALSVQHQPLAHFRYPALYNTAFHYGSILRSTCPHQSVSLSAPPYIRAPQFGQMG